MTEAGIIQLFQPFQNFPFKVTEIKSWNQFTVLSIFLCLSELSFWTVFCLIRLFHAVTFIFLPLDVQDFLFCETVQVVKYG